jgi:hypothetical protein
MGVLLIGGGMSCNTKCSQRQPWPLPAAASSSWAEAEKGRPADGAQRLARKYFMFGRLSEAKTRSNGSKAPARDPPMHNAGGGSKRQAATSAH